MNRKYQGRTVLKFLMEQYLQNRLLVCLNILNRYAKLDQHKMIKFCEQVLILKL